MLKRIDGHTINSPLTSIVIDIGCGNWKFSELAIQNGASKIIGFDPDSRIKKHKDKRIIFNNIAVVGNECGKKLFCEYEHHKSSCLREYQTDLFPSKCIKTREVNIISITEIAETYKNVELVKLDCEGSEMEILANWNIPFSKYVSVEFHLHHMYPQDRQIKIPLNFLFLYDIISHELSYYNGKLNYWDSFFVRKNSVN